MPNTDKIKKIMIDRHMTHKELAEKINQSAANLSNKMRRDNFCEKDLIAIAEALGCEYKGIFIDKETGKEIKE